MAHIAVVISGLSGRMHSGFELISRLEKEGHRVTCLCQPNTTETVAKQGFDYLEIPAINFKYIDPEAKAFQSSWFQKWKRHVNNRSGRYAQGKKLLHLADYEKIWAEIKPDHALIDVELHDLIFTAYVEKISVTLFHTWFSDTRSLELPPIRTSIRPGMGFEGSILGIAWSRFLDWAKIQMRLSINTLRFQEYRRTTIKKYAAEIGFPVSDLIVSTLPPLYSFKKIPILLLTMRELDFPHKPDNNVTYVGPMVYENRNDLERDSHVAKRLAAIFKAKKASGKKLIYCSVSSFVKGDALFLQRVVQAVQEQTDWLLIVSTGGNLSKETFGDLRENIHIFDWLPQLKVLENADCSINHAGINSINECLHYSVPMLVYSGGMFDQNGNAARMAYHGVAILGDKNKDSADQIRKNLKAILTNQKYQEKISKFNRLYGTYRQRALSPVVLRGGQQ